MRAGGIGGARGRTGSCRAHGGTRPVAGADCRQHTPAGCSGLGTGGSPAFRTRDRVGGRGIGREYLRRYIAACEQVGSTLLRVVIDSAGNEPSQEQAADRISAFIPELEAAGVTLAIENHDRFRAAQFAEIVRSVNSPRVRICLDTANSFGSLEGPDVVFDTLLPLAVNLHLKDFAVHRFADSMGFQVVGAPAGEGRLNCPSLIRRLYELRPEANVILELWPPAEQDLNRPSGRRSRGSGRASIICCP